MVKGVGIGLLLSGRTVEMVLDDEMVVLGNFLFLSLRRVGRCMDIGADQ